MSVFYLKIVIQIYDTPNHKRVILCFFPQEVYFTSSFQIISGSLFSFS